MAKFRSWNEEAKEFVYFEDGKYSIESSICLKPEDYFNWSNSEQSTGLFDKHKQELTKGDKITCAGQKTLIVDWDNGTAGWCFVTDEGLELDYQMLLEDWDSVEIIGHIHEVKDES